jgi:hypothetical protein
VDGDVVDLLQVALEALAVAAVRVLEQRHLALAVAAHDGERILQGQRVEVDRQSFSSRSWVRLRRCLVSIIWPVDEVAAIGVGVVQVAADAHFVHARHGRLGDLVDAAHLRHPLGEVLADGASWAAAPRLASSRAASNAVLVRVIVIPVLSIKVRPAACRTTQSFSGPLRSKPSCPSCAAPPRAVVLREQLLQPVGRPPIASTSALRARS